MRTVSGSSSPCVLDARDSISLPYVPYARWWGAIPRCLDCMRTGFARVAAACVLGLWGGSASGAMRFWNYGS